MLQITQNVSLSIYAVRIDDHDGGTVAAMHDHLNETCRKARLVHEQ